MKVVSILAAASLALTPAIASAGSSGENTDSTAIGYPISGPLAGRVLDASAIPVGAIVIGSLVLFGGALFILLSDGDSNNDSQGGTTESE